MRRLIVVGGLMVLAVLVGTAQERIVPQSSFVTNFDYARFHNNDSTQYVEMYFAFFPQLVTLAKSGDHYIGYVALRTQIAATGSGELLVDKRSLMPVRVKDSSDASYRNTLVTQMGFLLPYGEYSLRIDAVDSLAQGRVDSILMPLSIGADSTSPSMSDAQLCSSIRRSDKKGDPFYKNTYEVIPNPTLLFGASNYPVIFHYMELYGLDPSATYIVKTIIADGKGKPLQESSRKRKFGVPNAVEVGTTNSTKLASGKYEFQVYLLSEASQPIARTAKSFYAYNPQLNAPSTSDTKMKETELSGLTADELDQEFLEAQYEASQEEKKTYSKITSIEGKRAFLAKFWSQVERGKMGHAPITRQEYLLRVEKANNRYRALSRPGWKTDRGRVFILYAEPDEVERRPSNEGGKPYEIWSYYQIENGVIFVFVDRTGFGDYILVHSTKRGELRDDDWQRFLQQ